MNDERLGKEIGEFYRETDAAPPDSKESAHQVASRLTQTPQVKRHRWLPTWLERSSHPSESIPSDDGQPPTVSGRTRSMLNPATAITAGALVFAIGGAFFVAQPFDQPGDAPGAEAEVSAPMWITGSIKAAPSCTDAQIEYDDDVRRVRGAECNPQTWESSDPRLTGEVVRRWNTDIYQTDEGSFSVEMDTATLRNDGGSWVCTNKDLLRGDGRSADLVGGPAYTLACVGGEGHEGLSAILVSEFSTGADEEFVGLIFQGDFPPQPEPPAAE